MDGIHDIGGMDGLGRVPVEADATFHDDWERQIHGIMKVLIARGYFNTHEFRHARERIDPGYYLDGTYYDIWLTGVEKLLIEKGVLSVDELEARTAAFAADDRETVPERDDPPLREAVAEFVYGDTGEAVEQVPPQFDVGDRVRVRNHHPEGHTRSPGYARRCEGVVHETYGTFPVADDRAHGGDAAEPLYNVRFDARDLWGSAHGDGTVHIDMWERHIEPATE